MIVPLYSTIQRNVPRNVFFSTPPQTPKVVVATIIAETSITVPGIRYVVDQGVAKTLPVTGTSQGRYPFASASSCMPRRRL